jgi:hypothetical protein
MIDIKAIGITTTVVVITGAIFLMIYWAAIIIFPMIILGFIATITYIISSKPTDDEDITPRYDFRN